MGTKAASAPTLADEIFSALSQRIVAGELAGGARLRQDEIAASFGASHVPVREAFRRLEAEGLVESLPRRGVRVASVDRHALYEVIEMRAALEALALRHAAERYPTGHLALLAQADAQCSLAETHEEWQAGNRQFHSLLIEPCPLPRLMQQVDRLHALSSRMMRMLPQPRTLPLPRDDRDHKAILVALNARDFEGAANHLARHIRRSYRAPANNR